MCCSASFLFQRSSGPVRDLPCLSQAFPHFPPKAGLGELCKPKVSPPRAEPGWGSPAPQKCFYLRKERAFPFLFSQLGSRGGTLLLLGARSRCRCKAAAETRGNLSPGLGTRGEEQYHVIYPEPLKFCTGVFRGRDKGGPCHKDTKLVGLEVAAHPQRNPPEVSLLCSPAEVPELTPPSRWGKADGKAAQKQGDFFPVWGLDGVMVKGIYTS